tara:strand:- start:284 stop:430 length:147 start_codon:yes stop_codon:yes gene_type:complete
MKEQLELKLFDDIAKGKETDGNKVVASLYKEAATDKKDSKKLVEAVYE